MGFYVQIKLESVPHALRTIDGVNEHDDDTGYVTGRTPDRVIATIYGRNFEVYGDTAQCHCSTGGRLYDDLLTWAGENNVPLTRDDTAPEDSAEEENAAEGEEEH